MIKISGASLGQETEVLSERANKKGDQSPMLVDKHKKRINSIIKSDLDAGDMSIIERKLQSSEDATS